jgi:hypothetical protein
MPHDKYWLTNLADEILTLETDQALLKTIGRLALDLEQSAAPGYRAALAALISGMSERALANHPALAGASNLVPRIRALFHGDMPESAKLLVCRPDALISGACGDLPRRLVWNLLDRPAGAAGVAGGNLGFQLGGDASSGLVFDLGVTPPPGATLPPGTSLLRLSLKGGAKAAAKLDFPVRLGSAGVDLDSASAMDVDFYFTVPADAILATAAADCLASLANPFSLDDVADKLRRTGLLAISIGADGWMAIGGRLQVGLAPHLAGSVEASPGVQAGFRISRSGRFRMNLTPGDGAGAPGTVLLDLERERASARAKSIGIGLALGLTKLVDDLKSQILEQTGKAQRLLGSFDEFLPPSKFARKTIESEIRARIGFPGSEQAVGELFDDAAHTLALDRLVQEVGTAIDTRARLWQDKAARLSTEAARDLLESWRSAPGTPDDQAYRAELITLIGPLVTPVIESSIQKLHTGLKAKLKRQTGANDALFKDLVSRLQDAGADVSDRASTAGARLDEVAAPVTVQLSRFQQTLSKLVSALKRSGEVKVDARWRWEEQRSEGQTLTQQILFRPSRSDAERNGPHSAERLFSQALTGSLDSVFEAVLAHSTQDASSPVSLRDGSLKRFAGLERSSGFELILLDFQLGTRDMLKADAEVETDAGGNIRVYARSESSVGWFGFGEKRELRTVNVYELATARKTRRMTFSLSLSQLDEDLEHKEVEQFFSGLEDGHIGLLPKGRAATAIAELKKVAKTNPDAARSGELRVWLELEDDAVRRLLQIRGTDPANRFAPFDDDRVYEVSIDAMLAGLAVTGSGTVSRNLERFVTKETSAGSLRTLLMDFNSDHHRRALRPHPDDSGFLGSATTEYDLLVRISDRARGFAKALQAMRAVYFASPDWSATDYRDRQEQIDGHIKFWVKGEPADKGLLSLFRDDSIRPYMLGFLKAVTDLVRSDDAKSGKGQLLASIVLHLKDGREREVRLSTPPPAPTPQMPHPDVLAGLAFDKSRVPPTFVRNKGPERA